MQEARFAGACQDQHAGRPAASLGWPGERKSIGATSRGKRRFSKNCLVGISKGNQSVTGLGARARAGPSRGLEPGPPRSGPGEKRARDTPPTPPRS